eukprot:TRINITY_DN35800_c0_g1_i6.p1 TRINITY_DN35800_c0_g1~~TRINITY_DN35800_c0_g1_i6.p1  ORF type:complete len:459 (-),score=144.94 TRINITY_DN35800_c0_g1_i6:753-2129(-)
MAAFRRPVNLLWLFTSLAWSLGGCIASRLEEPNEGAAAPAAEAAPAAAQQPAVDPKSSVVQTETKTAVDLASSIKSMQEWKNMLTGAGKKPVMVMFYQPGCPLCQQLHPTYYDMASQFGDKAEFKQWDVSVNSDISYQQNVQQLPTFQFFVGGTKVRECGQPGGRPANVESLVQTAQEALMDSARMNDEESRMADSIAEVAERVKKAKGKRHEKSKTSACSSARAKREHPEKVVILGGGPAGLSAAVYAARSGFCPLILAQEYGGQLEQKGAEVENYAGLAQLNGEQMIDTMLKQAEHFDAELLNDRVESVDLNRGRDGTGPLTVRTKSNGEFLADSMIISLGSTSRWLGVPGESEFKGKGVSNCANCDGFKHKGKDCMVVGGGDSAAEDALLLSRICKNVKMVHRRDQLKANNLLQTRIKSNPNIEILWNSEVQSFAGDKAAEQGGELAKDRGYKFL